LANSEQLQAVAHDGLRLVGAALYQPGKVEIRPGRSLQVDKPCLLLAQEQDGRLTVTVANPENKAVVVRATIVAADGQTASKELVVDLPDGYDAGSSVTRTIAFD
jgi:hypothetical protein